MDIIFFSGFSYPRILASDFLKRDKLHITRIMTLGTKMNSARFSSLMLRWVRNCSKNLSRALLPVSLNLLWVIFGSYPAWCKLLNILHFQKYKKERSRRWYHWTGKTRSIFTHNTIPYTMLETLFHTYLKNLSRGSNMIGYT